MDSAEIQRKRSNGIEISRKKKQRSKAKRDGVFPVGRGSSGGVQGVRCPGEHQARAVLIEVVLLAEEVGVTSRLAFSQHV